MNPENQNNSFSRRAHELLSDLRYASSKSVQSDFHWKIDYSRESSQLQNDKILTLQYSSPVKNNLENIFLESICRLAKGKTMQFLFAVSYREIESFLRDENHIPAFSESIVPEAQTILGRVKKSLLVEILLGDLEKSGLSEKKKWPVLTIVEKNRAVASLFFELGKVFSQGKKLELILAEDNTVTVKKNDFPLDLEIIEALMGQIFFKHESISPLKVIGTL
jgi:hypothetical protein